MLIVRALWHVALTSIVGFFAAIGIFIGCALGAGFLVIGILKPIFPGFVGFWFEGPERLPSFGVRIPPPGPLVGGNWVILIGLGCGLLILVLTHRCAKRFLAWFRPRIGRNARNGTAPA